MLLLIETALAAAAILVSLTSDRLGERWFARMEDAFRAIGRRRALAALLVVVAALAARAVVLPVLPVPKPKVDDEFSHLLLADTLLQGRLANPTPTLWDHFETLEVNMTPTYASVYQPVQGMFLAAGRLLSGSAFFGVMLSVAVMCGAICWMLQGWMPGEWALLGGLLAILRFGVFSYWADTYMGGAPAAIGGALVLGALPRLRQEARARDAAIMGLGFAVLANSRPYEGFLLSAAAGIALVYWLFQERKVPARIVMVRIFAPLAAVLVLAALGTAYYFWRVTGSPLKSPYEVNWSTYGMMPKFVFQTLRPRQQMAVRHEALREFFYVFEYKTYELTRTAGGLLTQSAIRLGQNWAFYFGPLLTLPFLAAVATAPYGFSWKHLARDTRFFVLCVLLLGAGLAAELFSYPHYASPLTCVLIALVLAAMRHVRGQEFRGRRFGVLLTRAIPALLLLVVVLRAFATPVHISMARRLLPALYDAPRRDVPSQVVQASLERLPGQHLVLVQFPAGAEDWMGWVHNAADIDGSKIVWAWDMGAEKNQELLNYYRGRSVWLVNAADDTPAARPYPQGTGN